MTVERALRWLQKLELCESKAAKLILMQGLIKEAVTEALLEMKVYDDQSFHAFDENGRPCQFFQDGTRKYK